MVGLALGVMASSSAQAARDDFETLLKNSPNAWRYHEDVDYKYAQGSPSNTLSLSETVPHHAMTIKVNQNVIDSFTFKVGCMLQSATPLFELRVNSLDIRLYDSVNDYVYARLLVDENQEFSLRGEIVGRNRIIFAPITRTQEKAISDLFLQLREGGELKIGLLQGKNDRVRVFKVPLAGFVEYSDKLLQSCQNYHRYFNGKQQFLPDYMSKEPDGYAPKDYTLVDKKDDVVDPFAPKPIEEEPAVVKKEEPKQEKPEAKKPEVLPFAPGGGPVSIGPDGLPIGANGADVGANKGQNVDKAIGKAAGPLKIGPDGNPIGADTKTNGTTDTNNTNNTDTNADVPIF